MVESKVEKKDAPKEVEIKEEIKVKKSVKETKEANGTTDKSSNKENTNIKINLKENEKGKDKDKEKNKEEDKDKNKESTEKKDQLKEDDIPTPQKLKQAEEELAELISMKRKVDRNLVNLEASIYSFEGNYLEETSQFGNIIKGFDGYMSNRPEKKKIKFTEEDRLFSQSSATYQAALEIKKREEENIQEGHHKKVSIKKKGIKDKTKKE
ncbi:NuA4-domain-containing protein [Neocallimastix lanati (nom. inval.)]|uniref:Chromatin modification-related protein EAF6 n=1 Tax=Neocallimastix californiae TaxID=1754190 RepID=A0A1Y2ANF4_9FUNG|nr:NuA4-domain-containing protein [Neocallimastix sp. JGI-2020a]ORY24103.1 NuA4-domain-containing protein [Neocallimastix californiae]|eukprot:ORY24103.1 NuA4-domain-containing protein [Neocallimastix californiae]